MLRTDGNAHYIGCDVPIGTGDAAACTLWQVDFFGWMVSVEGSDYQIGCEVGI